MKKKGLFFLLAALVLIAICGISAWIGLRFWVAGTIDPPLMWEGAEWVDDWFAVEHIDEATFIIGEPRYWQVNFNYLIIGESRAILFDTGPGARDITPVVKKLTSVPITVLSSHFHFDHVGNHERFDKFALVDLPFVREQVKDGFFRPSLAQCLSPARPQCRVTEWVKPGEYIDLRNRRLHVIHVPGHAPESIALFDQDRRQIFIGDFIYPGDLIAFTPGANLQEYLKSTRRLLAMTNGDETLFGAHMSSQLKQLSPRLKHTALVELEQGLESVINGDAVYEKEFFLRRYKISEDMSLLTSNSPTQKE